MIIIVKILISLGYLLTVTEFLEQVPLRCTRLQIALAAGVGALVILLLQLYENNCSQNFVSNDRPLVFIGGHPRSGTTLMRVMLDVHPMIRCTPETRVIPRILFQLEKLEHGVENQRLRAANLYPNPIMKAFAAFIRTIIESSGDQAPVLCNKDPMNFKDLRLLHELFPTAKFIHMVRDGRAVTASMIKRKISMGNIALEAESQMRRWENITSAMLNQCENMGGNVCLTVQYERLVLRPRENMLRILEFLDVPWDSVVLHHQDFIGKESFVSSMEPSTAQVKYPLYLSALSFWASPNSSLPRNFIDSAHLKSDLLKRLGYSNVGIPPNYGSPEAWVINNTKRLETDKTFQNLFT